MTTNDTVPTWRDLAGQLTAAQVERFAERDRLYGGEPGWQQLLIRQAREDVKGNRVDAERFAHVAAPAGAAVVDHWRVDPDEGGWFRYFEGRRLEVGPLEVLVLGRQFPDGRVECSVGIEADSLDFSAEQVREIAAGLLAAADDLDRATVTR